MKIERLTRTPDNDPWYVRPYILTDLDKAWADIYWTFQEEAFDLTDNHIGRYTAPIPFSNDKYFSIYAEVPF